MRSSFSTCSRTTFRVAISVCKDNSRTSPLPRATWLTRASNDLSPPCSRTTPKTLRRPRIWLRMSVRVPTSCARAPRTARTLWFDPDLPVPAGAHDLRQTEGIVPIGFVDLHAERCFCMPGIDADYRQPHFLECVPVPGRQRPGLKTNSDRVRRSYPDCSCDLFGC